MEARRAMDTFITFLTVLVVMFFVARRYLKTLLPKHSKEQSGANTGDGLPGDPA
jgi:hypothetical protein